MVLGAKTMGKTAYARKAEDYAAYRPAYAEEAVCALCKLVGLESSWTVADVGSGTGNVARHLVGRVAKVFAVEPDDAMRQQAERLLGRHPGFVSITGTAEATTLPDRSVELITVGQAFHWFDAVKTAWEFDRILKADGWLALIWNRFAQETDPDLSVVLPEDKCNRLSFPVTIRESWLQYIGGARSVARYPIQGDPGYEEFEREQRQHFNARAVDGMIEVRYATELAVGRMNRSVRA